ncbi:MAG: hypothetical protein AAGC60_30350 [Acidobacteriota bacterium]
MSFHRWNSPRLGAAIWSVLLVALGTSSWAGPQAEDADLLLEIDAAMTRSDAVFELEASEPTTRELGVEWWAVGLLPSPQDGVRGVSGMAVQGTGDRGEPIVSIAYRPSDEPVARVHVHRAAAERGFGADQVSTWQILRFVQQDLEALSHSEARLPAKAAAGPDPDPVGGGASCATARAAYAASLATASNACLSAVTTPQQVLCAAALVTVANAFRTMISECGPDEMNLYSCFPNTSQVCLCAYPRDCNGGQATGLRVCNPDGQGWGPCNGCPAAPPEGCDECRFPGEVDSSNYCAEQECTQGSGYRECDVFANGQLLWDDCICEGDDLILECDYEGQINPNGCSQPISCPTGGTPQQVCIQDSEGNRQWSECHCSNDGPGGGIGDPPQNVEARLVRSIRYCRSCSAWSDAPPFNCEEWNRWSVCGYW